MITIEPSPDELQLDKILLDRRRFRELNAEMEHRGSALRELFHLRFGPFPAEVVWREQKLTVDVADHQDTRLNTYLDKRRPHLRSCGSVLITWVKLLRIHVVF